MMTNKKKKQQKITNKSTDKYNLDNNPVELEEREK